MEAWSKEQLGWVSVVPATVSGGYAVSPVVTRDTLLLVRPPAGISNTRGEYFLLENRQAVGSDTANIATGGNAGPKNGGLLIWHVDSLKLVSGGGVNSGPIHGVALVQADGLGQLDLTSGGNRGDAVDPFPGSAGTSAFSDATNPAARLNAGGASAGIVLDSIRQAVTGGEMAFRLRFGWLLVTTLGPGTIASTPGPLEDVVTIPGTIVTMVAKPNADAFFRGWSGDTVMNRDTLTVTLTTERSFVVSAAFERFLVTSPPAPVTAVMGASFSIPLSVSGGTGSYNWTLLSGTLPTGVTVKSNGVVSGVPEQTGSFAANVQVASGTQTKSIPVAVNVTAPALTTSAVLGVLLGTGGTLTTDERRYLDLLGNRNTRLDVGDFHAFIATTGGAVSAEMMAELLRKDGAR
jgi:hypothetical protein